MTGSASLEAGLSTDTKIFSTIYQGVGPNVMMAFASHDNIFWMNFDGIAAASLKAKMMGAKLTQPVLSGGSHGHFMLVG